VKVDPDSEKYEYQKRHPPVRTLAAVPDVLPVSASNSTCHGRTPQAFPPLMRENLWPEATKFDGPDTITPRTAP